MVHVFECRGHYYIFDTGSSALHECDEKAARLLRARMGEDADTSDISAEERKAYEEDFAELEQGGLLFAPETAVRPVKSNEVKALCLHICHDCNLRCRYCFADEGAYHSRREFMSLETAKKAIDFLIANSGHRRVLETDFFGGEPLMNFDVVKQTVYYAKEEASKRGKEFRFTLTTNGLLLKDDVAAFLNEEMDNVVPLAGRPQRVHDAVRKTANGKGSFDLVIQNLKNFVSIRGDKSYYVRGTFTAQKSRFFQGRALPRRQRLRQHLLEPVVTDIEDLAIGKEHLPAIADEYDRLCDAYLSRMAEGKGFNFFHFNVDLEGAPASQSV